MPRKKAPRKLTGLAAKVDRLHRQHKGRPHPKRVTWHGTTYKMGGK